MDSRRLNIVHLIEPGGGGTMRHVLDLARAQADISHNVTIVYSPLRLEPAYEVQLRQLPNVTLHALPLRRAPHGSDLVNLFGLLKILHKEKPHILHAHSTKAGLIARLVRIFYKTKVIYTPHAMVSMNPDLPRWKKQIYAAYETTLALFMDKMIALTPREVTQARALGIPARKIMMAQNGTAPLPPADRAALRHAQTIADDDRVIGFVGRMVPQKNPELALRAFAMAQRVMPNLIFYAIGDGELLTPCQTAAQDLGVADRVRWLGGADARHHYAAMDLLLVTSRYELMAYSYLEAMQAGLPIVTTDAAGGAEVCVVPGQTGEITAADPTMLAIHITKILNDPTLCDAMRFAARAQAQNFCIPQMLKSVMAVYAAAL